MIKFINNDGDYQSSLEFEPTDYDWVTLVPFFQRFLTGMGYEFCDDFDMQQILFEAHEKQLKKELAYVSPVGRL